MPTIETKMVIHFRDGKMVKGSSYDFTSNK
jgi:ketosteroid isomerase-like protein